MPGELFERERLLHAGNEVIARLSHSNIHREPGVIGRGHACPKERFLERISGEIGRVRNLALSRGNQPVHRGAELFSHFALFDVQHLHAIVRLRPAEPDVALRLGRKMDPEQMPFSGLRRRAVVLEILGCVQDSVARPGGARTVGCAELAAAGDRIDEQPVAAAARAPGCIGALAVEFTAMQVRYWKMNLSWPLAHVARSYRKKATPSIPFGSGCAKVVSTMTQAFTSIVSERKTQFDELGYCVAADLFTETEIGDIENFFEEFKVSGEGVFDAGTRDYKEIDFTKNQLRSMHPHRFSARAMGWFLNPNVAAVLEELLGRPALGVQTMYYFKPPGGKGQGMHQDNFYLLSMPATCIAAWTAIDSADLDNGCLWVVPGSHRGPIHCPEEGGARWMNYGDSHITRFPREQKPVAVPVRRGETMFFSGNLIHGSGPNRTKDRFRRTFIGHYIDEASDQVARFYHPVLNMRGEVVSNIAIPEGGGPCGDGWKGAEH